MVKAGDIVQVKVMDVDIQRKRIGLSMRMDDKAREDSRSSKTGPSRRNTPSPRKPRNEKPAGNGAMAQAFAQAKGRK